MRFGAEIVGYAKRGWVLGILAALAALIAGPASTAAMLPAHVRVGAAPRDPSRSRVLGGLSGSTALQVNVTLEPRDPAALASYAAAVSTPGSSLYHRYLTVSEFRRRFGPSPSQIGAVEASLRAHGLAPGPVSANGLAIPVEASSARLAHAFSLSFDRVALPSGRTAFVNTRAPQFDSSVASVVQGVVGLDSITAPQPQIIRRRRVAHAPRAVSGQSGHVATGGPQPCSAAKQSASEWSSYTADQLASAYQFSSLYTAGDEGAGETIALFELEPNSTADIAAYQSCYGTHASVSYVEVDGGAGSGSGEGEAALDIEDVIGLAPQANVLVYQGPNSGSGAYDTYARIVNDDQASVISTSWGACEPDAGSASAQAENTLFEEAATQGQSVFAAAGDTGSEDCQRGDGSTGLAVDDPASQPYVTGVGGTTMSTVGPPPSQSVWNESALSDGAGGGGISSLWTMPSYQSGAAGSLNVINGSSSATPCGAGSGSYCREVPDVSADADPNTGYLIYYEGGWTGIGGTSAAAPLWAAFMALVDASSSCNGTPVGFANPALYAAAGTSYSSDFGDVTTGNNDYTGTNGGAFGAGTGYDMASGLGTPIGSRLPADLCANAGSGSGGGGGGGVGAGGGDTITIANPGTQRGTVASAASLQIDATDSNSGATISYSASGLPTGLAIDAASGLISGAPVAVGSYDARVTATDTAGASRSVTFSWIITTRPTTTSVTCAPAALAPGAATTCTATVSDAGAGGASTPTGTISLGSTAAGTFSGTGWCVPVQASAASASCSLTYQPTVAGTPEITASYSGDGVHSSSAGTTGLTVSGTTGSGPGHGGSSPAPTGSAGAGITGTLSPGHAIGCPAAPGGERSYQWVRDGTPIAGARSASYVLQLIDEGNTLTCVETVASAAAAGPPVLSASVKVPVTPTRGCPAATGAAGGTRLGLLRLGMTRRQARRAYGGSTDRASRNQDAFCLTPIGLRAGYASGRLLGTVASSQRGRVAGRVAWILTGSAFFAIDGVRVGATLDAARGRLALGKPIATGAGRWYLAAAGGATVLLEVRGGIVQQIGLASRPVSATRAQQRVLLGSI